MVLYPIVLPSVGHRSTKASSGMVTIHLKRNNIISIYLLSILFSIPEGLNRIMAFFNKSNIYKDSIGVCIYPMYIHIG